jgi:hypothetical protein
MSSFQSPFFFKFSLRELVERNRSLRGLSCSAGGGGGGIGGGSGGVGRKHSSFHKGESLTCQLTDVEQFDEAKFIQALKRSVETDLEGCKAKIVKSADVNVTGFDIEYTLEEIRGRVEISGNKDPGNYYSLKADLEEKSGEAK